ncbi:MAG: RNA polymerase factor sigma-54 [Planctomycetota bacterium]|nr:RNA polymerase factor sigma-54 [Planctomycetota bacterium]
MRFDVSHNLKLGQSLKLAPRMIQSMEILQMSVADLEERIEQELESNPTLEVREGDDPTPSNLDSASGDDSDAARLDALNAERTNLEDARASEAGSLELNLDTASGTDDFARLGEFQDDNPEFAENAFEASDASDHERPLDLRDLEYRPTHRETGDRDAKMDAMSATPARSASLQEQLRDQWALCDVDPALKPLGETIISFLDDDGYLRTPLETIADKMPGDKATPAELERALTAAQLFLDPPGVAARDARECLLLQLDALLDDPREGKAEIPGSLIAAAKVVVSKHLDDLMQNRLPRIAERSGLELDQIKQAIMLLKKLSLAPARRLVESAPTPITPDAIVEYDPDEDRYVAYLNETRVPNLRVNQEYALLARDRDADKRTREFVKTNLSNAQWLIEAVEQRRRTLLKVVREVVKAQREYFDFGPQALKPLPMTEVAEKIGVHVATVSRAVAEKYIQTPRGVVALRKFFTGGTQTESGEEVAWDAIKQALKDVIEAEDKAKPFSDEALVDELKKRGIEIARRTIAKYRDQLGIPAARLRRSF